LTITRSDEDLVESVMVSEDFLVAVEGCSMPRDRICEIVLGAPIDIGLDGAPVDVDVMGSAKVERSLIQQAGDDYRGGAGLKGILPCSSVHEDPEGNTDE
jgi:hypothetical protein